MAGPDDKGIEALDSGRLRSGMLAAVAIGLTVGMVVAVVTGGPAVIAGIRRIPLAFLAAALLLSVASWFGQGLGFAALTTLGVRGNVPRMTKAFLAGDFPALVTPFGSGGIPAGIYALTREGLSTGEASAVIAMHSLLTAAFFVAAGVVAVVALPLHRSGSTELFWAGFGALATMLFLVVAIAVRPEYAARLLQRVLSAAAVRRLLGLDRAKRLAEAADREAARFATDVRSLTRKRPSALILSFAGLFVSRVCLIAALPVIMYGMGWRGEALPLLATAVGGMALMIASPTPGGSGVVEAATTALLATQVAAPEAAAAALLWRAVTYYTELLAGWVMMTRYLAGSRRTATREED